MNATFTKRPECRKHIKYSDRENMSIMASQKSIFSGKKNLKGLIFCVTIIVGLNRMFFQFGPCNHSLKHILIEKVS